VNASTLADQTLHALVVHRMLASDQLHRMMSPGSTIDATYYRLGQLRRAGLADGFPVRSGQRAQHKVWHATAAGVERALSDPDLTRRYVVTRPKTSRNLVAHTLAVNEPAWPSSPTPAATPAMNATTCRGNTKSPTASAPNGAATPT